MCNGISTFIQLCMFNAMLGFVNMASAICMLTLSFFSASIVMLCHALQTVSSQYAILKFDHFGFDTRSVKMTMRILTFSL